MRRVFSSDEEFNVDLAPFKHVFLCLTGSLRSAFNAFKWAEVSLSKQAKSCIGADVTYLLHDSCQETIT